MARLRTSRQVQLFLNELPYNDEVPPARGTLRSFRGVVRHWNAHCMEAALAAAVILEHRGYPPLVLSLESIDCLDHVLFVYRQGNSWGSVARSRDPGLHGRRPVFRTARDLALSYVDPYVDLTGRIVGYAVVDLRTLGRYDWRFSTRNIWKAERLLQDYPHRPIRSSDGSPVSGADSWSSWIGIQSEDRCITRARKRGARYRRAHGGGKDCNPQLS